jgi:hypothetical protein
MAIAYDALGNVIGDISDPISPTATQPQIRRIDNAIAAKKKNAKPKPVVATSSVSAKPGNANDVSAIGLPTQSPQTRGDVSGSINSTNQQIIHSCDFANDLKKNIGLKKFLKAIAKWIREGIRKIQQLLGFSDPSGTFSETINMLKSAAEYIRYVIKEYIEPIIEFEKYVLAVLVKIRAIIQWILSLPGKLLKLLQDCLSKLLKSIASLFADAWAEAGNELGVKSTDVGKGYEELGAAIKDTAAAAKELLTATTTAAGLAVGVAVSGTVGLLAPVSEADIAGANKTITAYSGSVPSALEVPADPNFLKKSTP